MDRTTLNSASSQEMQISFRLQILQSSKHSMVNYIAIRNTQLLFVQSCLKIGLLRCLEKDKAFWAACFASSLDEKEKVEQQMRSC